MKLTVHKAEGTGRGNGWYFLVNGSKDGRTLTDIGGEDWYTSESAARLAGKYFMANCYYDKVYGWVVS